MKIIYCMKKLKKVKVNEKAEFKDKIAKNFRYSIIS